MHGNAYLVVVVVVVVASSSCSLNVYEVRDRSDYVFCELQVCYYTIMIYHIISVYYILHNIYKYTILYKPRCVDVVVTVTTVTLQNRSTL